MMKRYYSLYFIVFFCCLWIVLGCNEPRNNNDNEDIVEEQRVTEVRTTKATIGRIVSDISTTGTVFALREARILPKISGRIETILVSEGERVEQDQVLVRLEQQDFLLSKHRAEAALGTANAALQQLLAGARGEDIQGAKAALSQTRASLEEAKGEHDRIKRLYEARVASQQMYDTVKARYKIAQQSVRIASENLKKATAGPTEEDVLVTKARVREAEVGLEMAEQQFNDSVIRAPFSGIIAEKSLNEGELVSSMSPLALLRIVDIDVVKIECAIPENEMSRVKSGAKANIAVDAYPEDQFTGSIASISPVVDPASRTFKITIEILNPDHRLKPGMFVRVKIITEIHDNTVLIPRLAVTLVDGKEAVFVAENDTAVLREATIGLRDEQFVEIVQGVQAGEQVIIEGNYGLEDGTKIKMRK